MKKAFIEIGGWCLASVFLFAACQSAPQKEEKAAKDTMAMAKDTSDVFEHLLVDNRKDPGCGMPVSAGIADTAHYKGKVLGFCSKECKDVFLKNPEGLLASADMKK
jgi:YHS domain-containing protein